jgi:hypothetical protein
MMEMWIGTQSFIPKTLPNTSKMYYICPKMSFIIHFENRHYFFQVVSGIGLITNCTVCLIRSSKSTIFPLVNSSRMASW